MNWKASVRRTVNNLLEPAGFTLRRYQPELSCRRMLSAAVLRRSVDEFQNQMAYALINQPEIAAKLPNHNDIEQFIEEMHSCPLKQETGGGGASAAILLFAICRALRPDLLVESGVFRGFTTWVLNHASSQSRQLAFDISFAELQRIEADVEYQELDWMQVSIQSYQGVSNFVYFDDHVDQWRRIHEAFERGFKYLLFDDSLPSRALHNDGLAAFPTVDMLFEPALTDGEKITWETECGTFEYHHDGHFAEKTRALIEESIRLPDLRYIFGYRPANLVFVLLR